MHKFSWCVLVVGLGCASDPGQPTYVAALPIASCQDLDCDDGSACTVDACTPGVGCQHKPLPDWTPCSAGSICDGTGSCTAAQHAKGMVFIPAGTFWMGCNAVKDKHCAANELPQHKVELGSYYLDQTETTRAAYQACVQAHGCSAPSGAAFGSAHDLPVSSVSWEQAQTYCAWRGAGFSLPTEAQWEMAARGSCEKNGSTAEDPGCKAAMRTQPWGEKVPDCSLVVMKASQVGCGEGGPWAVGAKPAGDSPYGVHDLVGNVWEWTLDSLAAYDSAPQTDPLSVPGAPERVVRGGAYLNTVAFGLRAGVRTTELAPGGAAHLGFRCARGFP